MLERKFTQVLENFLLHEPRKILLVNGARQIGKSYLIRYVGKKLFKHYVEINLKADQEGNGIFANVKSKEDFYLQLGAIAGNNLGNKEDTLVFLDEIQSYPHLITMLKFLNEDAKYRYIASGSQLGVALSQTPSVPIGSVAIQQMFPLDFEEFLWAMGCGKETINAMQKKFMAKEALNDAMHNYMLQQFKIYLLVGGMPDAVNKFLENRNIAQVRAIQRDIYNLYKIDASQYDKEKKLVIRKIYDMIPSNMENKKKRIIVKNIEGLKSHKQFSDYAEEFEYLTNSGVALAVQAISCPAFPLIESESKNLLKLYLNDVGLLTNILYSTNINAVLGDSPVIGAGTYADNEGCAVSCTGHGEYFIRHVVAYNLSTRVKLLHQPVGEAADYIIHQELNTKEGNGGLIAVDKKGNFAMPFNSGGMFRGYLYKEKGTGKISKAVGIGKKMKTL